MGVYDNNKLIKLRFKALGSEKYYNAGYTGKGVKLGLIDTFSIDHGPQMESLKKYIAKDLDLTRYNMAKGHAHELAQCIEKAVKDGMEILSISRSVNHNRGDIRDAVRFAESRGVIIVASAGNYGDETPDYKEDKRYPAYYDETISVTCIDNDGMVSSFSSHNKKADTCSFGQNILLTKLNGQEGLASGTSPATAMVAYALALEIERYKDVNGERPTTDYCREFIKNNSVDLGAIGHDMFTGHGFFTLDKDAFESVMISLLDLNQNGKCDWMDDLKRRIESGKTYVQAMLEIKREYDTIRYEDGIPFFGSKKYWF